MSFYCGCENTDQSELDIQKETERSKKKKHTRKYKRDYTSYTTFIYKILKQYDPDLGISGNAMSIMNSFVNDVFDKIACEAGRLARYNKKSTLGHREIQTAVKFILPGQLAIHAIIAGKKALELSKKNDPNPLIYPIELLKHHSSHDDCWVIIGGKVYNITSLLLKDERFNTLIEPKHYGTNVTKLFANNHYLRSLKPQIDELYVGKSR